MILNNKNALQCNYKYDMNGNLVFPLGMCLCWWTIWVPEDIYRQWVFLSTSVDMRYCGWLSQNLVIHKNLDSWPQPEWIQVVFVLLYIRCIPIKCFWKNIWYFWEFSTCETWKYESPRTIIANEYFCLLRLIWNTAVDF